MNERIKEFLSLAYLEIHSINNEVTSIGLKWGYSKHLLNYGFSRKEQMQILNYLEKNPQVLKWK